MESFRSLPFLNIQKKIKKTKLHFSQYIKQKQKQQTATIKKLIRMRFYL